MTAANEDCNAESHTQNQSGAIAQLGERLVCIQEVCGSIPHSSTITAILLNATTTTGLTKAASGFFGQPTG